MAVSEGASKLQLSEDEKRLHELGYAQELRRRMTGFSNFAVSFTIISILSGMPDPVRLRHDQRWPGRHASGAGCSSA